MNMSNDFKTIALVGRDDDPRVTEAMTRLVHYLTGEGREVIAAPGILQESSVRQVAQESLASQADLMIAVGGDGTMLYAARLAHSGEKPLLGINRGRLGFLADISPDEIESSLGQVLGGNFTRESRLLLDTRIVDSAGKTRSSLALNDVVLQRRETGRMVDFKTSIAGRYVNTHSGDGLIVATPTGSTAYSLSCGGPIIEPALDAVVIVPICPHTLSDRPIVIPAGLEIEVNLLARTDTKAEVTIDGHSSGEITEGDRLLICGSDKRITLIHPPGYDYYEILRSNLHWGLDGRLRNFDSTNGANS
jgi:NAD+ kinase